MASESRKMIKSYYGPDHLESIIVKITSKIFLELFISQIVNFLLVISTNNKQKINYFS